MPATTRRTRAGGERLRVFDLVAQYRSGQPHLPGPQAPGRPEPAGQDDHADEDDGEQQPGCPQSTDDDDPGEGQGGTGDEERQFRRRPLLERFPADQPGYTPGLSQRGPARSGGTRIPLVPGSLNRHA